MADTITKAIDALTSAAFIEGGVSIERTDEARERTEQRKRELIEAIAACHPQAVAAQAPAAVPWENFPCYLIDHCEGDVITEEGLQHALAAMLANPQYSAATPALPATEDSSAGDLAEVQTEPAAWPATCDGKEQEAWEDWAKRERHDMSEHPLHYLFLNERTNAARQGWKAGLVYAVSQMQQRPLPAPQAQPADALDAKLLELVRSTVAFAQERGSVLQVHIDGLAELLAERSAMAAAQEGGNAAKEA